MTNFTINKHVKVLQNSVMQNNTVVYFNDDKVYIIDPSFEATSIYQDYQDYKNKVVILTHSHYDHIGNVSALNNFADVIIMSAKVKLNKKQMTSDIFFDTHELNWDKVKFVEDGDVYDNLRFYHTPGHSIDSMCVSINNEIMISGDHVFCNSIGRTDLPTSSPQQMIESLQYFKKVLKDNPSIHLVIPGHGKYVSVEELLDINHYLLV